MRLCRPSDRVETRDAREREVRLARITDWKFRALIGGDHYRHRRRHADVEKRGESNKVAGAAVLWPFSLLYGRNLHHSDYGDPTN